MEAKIKIILNTAKTRAEAQKLMQKERFRDEDIVRIVQKYYRLTLKLRLNNILSLAHFLIISDEAQKITSNILLPVRDNRVRVHPLHKPRQVKSCRLKINRFNWLGLLKIFTF